MKLLKIFTVLFLLICGLSGCTVTQEMKTNNLGDETYSATVYRFCGIPYWEQQRTTKTELPK